MARQKGPHYGPPGQYAGQLDAAGQQQQTAIAIFDDGLHTAGDVLPQKQDAANQIGQGLDQDAGASTQQQSGLTAVQGSVDAENAAEQQKKQGADLIGSGNSRRWCRVKA